jgi:hypothetical protein
VVDGAGTVGIVGALVGSSWWVAELVGNIDTAAIAACVASMAGLVSRSDVLPVDLRNLLTRWGGSRGSRSLVG